MPTVFRRTNNNPQQVGTSRTITIPTSPATQVVSLSGFMGWEITCLGPGAIAYGDSSLPMGSGALLYYSMNKTWYPIADTMSLFLRADSVATVININYFL